MDSKLGLANLINDWVKQEKLDGFSIVFPRDNDTIAVGYEGSIKYDHHSEGYATLVSIYGDYVYVDYDDVVFEASDPEFFPKLKAVLLHHQEVHKDCKHIRSLND